MKLGRIVGLMILVAIGFTSCGSEPPTAPTPPPSVAGLVRVELIAPRSIAPGESVQLTANAIRSDGSVENVSAQAQWTSSSPQVVEISSSGLAKGMARGEAAIRVVYQTRGASTNTFVLPAGTYRLVGTVTETGVRLRLAGISVSVIQGVGEGQTTTTDASGTYALYGVGGPVRLQAKGSGYFDEIQQIDVGDHRTFDFEMRLEGQRTDARGSYRLTVDRTKTSCPSAELPETRSYDALVTQDGPRLTVTLSGADFIVTGGRGNAFSGFLDGGNGVTFAIGDPDEYYYIYRQHELVERLSATQALIISGRVTAGLSPNEISGSLNGVFLLAAGTTPPFPRFAAVCNGVHRFEMVRR